MKLFENIIRNMGNINSNIDSWINRTTLDLVYKSIKRYVKKDVGPVDTATFLTYSGTVELYRELPMISDAIFTLIDSVVQNYHHKPITESQCIDVICTAIEQHGLQFDKNIPKEELRGLRYQMRIQFPSLIEFMYICQVDLEYVKETVPKFAMDALDPLFKNYTSIKTLEPVSVTQLWGTMINFGYTGANFITRYTPVRAYSLPVKNIICNYLTGCGSLFAILSISELTLIWAIFMKICPIGIFILCTIGIVLLALCLGKATDHILTENDRLFEYTNYGSFYTTLAQCLAEDEVRIIANCLDVFIPTSMLMRMEYSLDDDTKYLEECRKLEEYQKPLYMDNGLDKE